MTTIYVNTGYASVVNGAKYPITVLTNLGKILDSSFVYWGERYGEDYIEIEDEEETKIAIELLSESKMLYRIDKSYGEWQNVTPK